MASYSAFPVTNDELDMLLLSSPPLSSASQPLPGAMPPTLALPAPPHEPTPSLRRRSNSTMAMLLGTDDDELRCRYPSKLCRHTRVRKASGALHRYCAYHRDKANANQKRWVDRQRSEAASGSPTASTSSAASPSAVSSPSLNYAQTKYRWIMAASSKRDESRKDGDNNLREPGARAFDGAAILSDDDWNALLALLAPPSTPHEPSGSFTELRRRAASSPMLPTFATNDTY